MENAGDGEWATNTALTGTQMRTMGSKAVRPCSHGVKVRLVKLQHEAFEGSGVSRIICTLTYLISKFKSLGTSLFGTASSYARVIEL